MKVIALETGFDNVQLRNPGDVFDLPDEVVLHGGPVWFEPVAAADKEKFEAAKKAYVKPQVAAVDPAKQAAAHEASLKALNEQHATTLKGLQDEIEALKKAHKPK
jgi:hypothetical protein